MARVLKVYRTPIGFHDAYVAASSQKAALEAWGADVDLFARGAAEVVTDEQLTEEPLKQPGTIVRRARGTSDEHLAALPKDRPARKPRPPAPDEDGEPPAPTARVARRASAAPTSSVAQPETRDKTKASKPARSSASTRKSPPRPSRAKLDAAEQAIEDVEADHASRIGEIRRREEELREERRKLEKRHEAELAKRNATLTKARDAYEAAVRKWRS